MWKKLTKLNPIRQKRKQDDRPDFEQTGPEGLSEAEALRRQKLGYGNHDSVNKPKSIGKIMAEHILTPFNMLNLFLFLVIVYVSLTHHLRYLVNGFFFGVAIVNTIGGIIQETKARKEMLRLSIINQMDITAIRDGQKKKIDIKDIVLGDLLELHYEDQIPVDAVFLSGANFRVDESLLTGESDFIEKKEGDILYSGSNVTSGNALAFVTKVGNDTYAAQISKEAHIIRKPNSEIKNALDKISKYLGLLIFVIGTAMILSKVLQADADPLAEILTSTVAALVGMIPEGLVLLNSAAFFIGVIALAKNNILVQRMSTIETLARIDVLCLDKTGTITTGDMQVEDIEFFTKSEEQILEAVERGLLALDDQNKTAQAILAYLATHGIPKQQTQDKIKRLYSFSSEKKWSGVFFEKAGLWLFGAPEILLANEELEKQQDYLSRRAKQGIRLLAVAYAPSDLEQDTIIPENLTLQCIIELSDTIREQAKETFDYFSKQDVKLKIISGDNPVTVQTIANKANISDLGKTIDLSQEQEPIPYEQIVDEYQFFGRVTPFQKKEIISTLQKKNHIVGMTGDGINDVPAMKIADCSIAMAEGSNVAKISSDLVLLNNNLSEMIPTVYEGRRIINNIERTAILFLTKTVYVVLLSIVFLFLKDPFPLFPIQMTLISSGTIGIPGFFLALLPNQNRVKGKFLPKTMQVSLPAGLVATLMVFLQYLTMPVFHIPKMYRSTITLCILLSISLLILWRVCKPFNRHTASIWLFSFVLVLLAFTIFPGIFFLEQLSGGILMYTIVYCGIALLLTVLFLKISQYIVKKYQLI